MSRVIAFRAWDTTSNSWVENHNLSVSADGLAMVFDSRCDRFRVRGMTVVLQQFTGLLDKNGKEIYEGDILRRNDGGIFEAKWWHAAWHFFTTNAKKANVFPSLMEVIGNIYENPELLAEQQKS